MRFALLFELKTPKFPLEYRKVIVSYIKNAISKCNDGKYYDQYFKESTQKDYCFSVILPKAKFVENEVELDGNEIKVLFSTDDKFKTGFILFNAFIAQKGKQYPLANNNFMTLKNIKVQKQEDIVNTKAIFKTTIGSGLCVRDHDRESNKDFYYVYNDVKFREKLKVVLTNQAINSGFTVEEINELKINPIQCKKVVVKHYRRYIDTSVGIFEIQGNSKILQHFYNAGIGSRKSIGFGMLDLVTQDLE